MGKRYLVQTFGCQMNVHDSRRIEEVLAREGYEATTDSADADLLLVNTCSIREKSEHKLMSLLGTFRPLKENRPSLKIVVAGCVAQQEGENLLRKANNVDAVIGPDNIPELPGILRNLDGGTRLTRTVFDEAEPTFLYARARQDEVSSFVTTMKGCDERCTYCIVPYTRGSERYRSGDDIVEEIRRLVDGGVKEITLLGQTVNSWFEDGTNKERSKMKTSRSEFADLLRRIASEVPDLKRLRYTSPHPRHLNAELAKAHAELDVLAKHLHLPVQSGSDAVLKRMSRRYSADEYIARVCELKESVPGLTLSTDIIVGFPGESDEDFEATLDLVRRSGFVASFCFKYSPRPFTPSLAMGDDVSEEEKDRRLQSLLALIAVQQSAHLNTLVGTTTKVLFEGKSRGGPHRFMGRSERNEIVHVDFDSGEYPVGNELDVHIDAAHQHSLAGSLLPGQTVSKRSTKKKSAMNRLPVVSR